MIDILTKAKALYNAEEYAVIEKAYYFAEKAHGEQKRESGEAYITHPASVAIILMDMEMDMATIAAALLHDVVEDTPVTYGEIAEGFGQEIADIVEGVTKLTRIKFASKEEQQAENLRKMFLAMAKDIRVILVKLADRLHNMRTLGICDEQKRIAVATETLDIYAPLANRLGIYQVKWELEDLSFRYMKPEIYKEINEAINQKREQRENYINGVIQIIRFKLEALGIHAEIYGRAKHFYSIYRKMQAHNCTIDQIYDLTAVRILVDNLRDCYEVLGVMHSEFKPMPGRFKDYIAMPKINNYQSLHTTVIGPNGTPFEIQIRTREMHEIAEYGIAAHWKYKEGSMAAKVTANEQKLTWMRKMLDFDSEAKDSIEFVNSLRTELFNDEVLVFTPKGDVIDLPIGSTPLDFAYAIHSAIGHRCIGAKINGRIVNLDAKLKTGDIVEVLTASATSGHGPSRDWLNIVVTNEAKAKIRQWFKKELREENIVKGREMLEREAKRQGYNISSLTHQEWLDIVFEKYKLQNTDDLYASIGYGGLTTHQVLMRLIEEYRKANKMAPKEEAQRQAKVGPKATQGVIVRGQSNMLVRFAHCCNPVPGDDIIGYITRGRGVSIHRKDCNNISGLEPERAIEVEWDLGAGSAYAAGIKMLTYDRSGILMDVSNQIYSANLNMLSINAQAKNGVAQITMMIEIQNTEQLDKLIKQLKKISGVIEVYRLNK